MKRILSDGNIHIVRLDRNEELLTSLTEYIAQSDITSGFFSAIGSATEAILSYYNLKSKAFEDHTISEDLEIISITGNISSLNNLPVIHAHGVLSKKDLSTLGGHIKKLVISATCEINLYKLHIPMKRQMDQETKLNLLK